MKNSITEQELQDVIQAVLDGEMTGYYRLIELAATDYEASSKQSGGYVRVDLIGAKDPGPSLEGRIINILCEADANCKSYIDEIYTNHAPEDLGSWLETHSVHQLWLLVFLKLWTSYAKSMTPTEGSADSELASLWYGLRGGYKCTLFELRRGEDDEGMVEQILARYPTHAPTLFLSALLNTPATQALHQYPSEQRAEVRHVFNPVIDADFLPAIDWLFVHTDWKSVDPSLLELQTRAAAQGYRPSAVHLASYYCTQFYLSFPNIMSPYIETKAIPSMVDAVLRGETSGYYYLIGFLENWDTEACTVYRQCIRDHLQTIRTVFAEKLAGNDINAHWLQTFMDLDLIGNPFFTKNKPALLAKKEKISALLAIDSNHAPSLFLRAFIGMPYKYMRFYKDEKLLAYLRNFDRLLELNFAPAIDRLFSQADWTDETFCSHILPLEASAVAQGYIPAKLQMMMYLSKIEPTRDSDFAVIKGFLEALNDINAMRCLQICYSTGIADFPKDETKANEWQRKVEVVLAQEANATRVNQFIDAQRRELTTIIQAKERRRQRDVAAGYQHKTADVWKTEIDAAVSLLHKLSSLRCTAVGQGQADDSVLFEQLPAKLRSAVDAVTAAHPLWLRKTGETTDTATYTSRLSRFCSGLHQGAAEVMAAVDEQVVGLRTAAAEFAV